MVRNLPSNAGNLGSIPGQESNSHSTTREPIHCNERWACCNWDPAPNKQIKYFLKGKKKGSEWWGKDITINQLVKRWIQPDQDNHKWATSISWVGENSSHGTTHDRVNLKQHQVPKVQSSRVRHCLPERAVLTPSSILAPPPPKWLLATCRRRGKSKGTDHSLSRCGGNNHVNSSLVFQLCLGLDFFLIYYIMNNMF